ncbi:hypothetical protein BGZ65_001927 [Modicella reniformis]|uniref:Uncharacterized protein n=1 Tax=Modicella reniformis TaxID=1440133 RepID=A0A9P6MJ11_9FUNG|nr:hypothetical protein BGZ65_001927 [Modicella reniformis]
MALDFLAGLASSLPKLEKLSLKTTRSTALANLSQGEVENVSMTVTSFDDLSPDEHEFFQKGHLIRLEIERIAAESVESRLPDIPRNNPRLSELDVSVPPRCITTVIDQIKTMERFCLQEQEHSSLEKSTFGVSISWKDFRNICITMKFPENSATPNILTSIRMLKSMTSEMTEDLRELIRDYEWSIHSLETNELFNDEFAILLDNATQERGS